MRMNGYAIRGGVEGRERLRLLSEVMGTRTRALLAAVGIPAGSVCLDLGCGGGDVTFDIARITGPGGRVTAVDIDEAKLEIARREAAQQGISNVVFEVQDINAWKPAEKFDVVYARFILTHLASPDTVIETLHRRIRPGGVMIVEDIDFRGHFAEPDCPALRTYVELYTNSVRQRGGDPEIGPRLPGLLRRAGFEDVCLQLHHPVALEGGIKLLTCVTLENIAEAVLDDKLITGSKLRETIEELYAFARDPTTVLGGPRVFQTWGYSGISDPSAGVRAGR